MSVGINYRRNISVGNSVAFLRFSGSESEPKRILLHERLIGKMTPSASSAPFTKNHPPMPVIASSTLNLHKTPYQHLQTLPQPPTTSPYSNPTDYPVTFTSNQAAFPVLPSEPPSKTFSPTSYANTPTGTDHLKLFFERFPSWVE
jgi:hypothetical protein